MTRSIRIVGGGIAGLVAANVAARSGAEVGLYETGSRLGGRARTRQESGFHFNMGPHALYNGGLGEQVLGELGIGVTGGSPPTSGGLAHHGGRLHSLPAGPLSLITTGLLGAGEKLALGRMLAGLSRLDPEPWDARPVRELTDELFTSARLQQLLQALVRLTCYAHAPDRMSAGVAIRQVQGALDVGVRYLDSGWQQMVDALRESAEAAGVAIHGGARVRSVELDGEQVRGIRLADDALAPADAVVLATSPAEASSLVRGGSDPVLAGQAERLLPVRAASLDVGLSRLPESRVRFALGIDQATYFSVHSGVAKKLAPEGGALLHVMRYLGPEEKPDRAELEAQLGGLLDQAQPGWRDVAVTKKLLGDVVVVHALPTAEMGGLAGRPAPEVAHVPGLWLAGDWVGAEGFLVDGAFASGRDAGRGAARSA